MLLSPFDLPTSIRLTQTFLQTLQPAKCARARHRGAPRRKGRREKYDRHRPSKDNGRGRGKNLRRNCEFLVTDDINVVASSELFYYQT